MAVITLVPKKEAPKPDISEVLAWLEHTKENLIEYGVTSIAIAYVDKEGYTGSGYIAQQPSALLGALALVQKEIIDSQYD